jgi:hypothetical protein
LAATYYDGQGFMVPRVLRINSALQLDGAKVCVQCGTTTIDNLADFFSSNSMTLQEVISSSTDEPGRRKWRFWRRDRADQHVGGEHHPICRQLRRSL